MTTSIDERTQPDTETFGYQRSCSGEVARFWWVPLAGVAAIALLIGVWCVAIVGIGIKLVFPGRYDRLAVGLYLAMGWSGMMLYDAVVKALPAMALWFIFAGGVLYSFGVIFHAWQRLRFQNAIWHGFVLLGAACHYTAILDTVLT